MANEKDNTFQWTDELVKEFVRAVKEAGFKTDVKLDYLQAAFKIAKPSHTSTEQAKERIEVSHFRSHDSFKGHDKAHWYQFCTSRHLAGFDIPTLVEKIEQVLNDEFISIYGNYTQTYLDEQIELAFNAARLVKPLEFNKYAFTTAADYKQYLSSSLPEGMTDWTKMQGLEIEKPLTTAIKDWEVECFTSVDGYNFWRQKSGGYRNQPFDKDIEEFHFLDHPEVYKIFSVRTLPDNTTWAVRQKVTSMRYGVINCEITGFKIIGDTMIALVAGANVEIQSLELPSPSSKPQDKPVLFTTEDGKDIRKGDRIWVVDTDWSFWEADLAHEESGKQIERKYFSTEQAAANYVKNNKPQFSLEEVVDEIKKNCDGTYKDYNYWSFPTGTNAATIIDALKKIAQSKINNQ